MGALPPNGQTAPMPDATIAAQIHQPFDVHGYVAAQITLDHIVMVDHFSDLNNFLIGQLIDPPFARNRRLFANLPGKAAANAMNISQRDIYTLVSRDIYTCNSSHSNFSSETLRVTALSY